MTDQSDGAFGSTGAGFTPGPWEMQPTVTAGEEPGVCIVGGNLGGLVGAALPWPTEIDSGDFSRVEANARLIAAAPDLLAALEDAIGALEQDLDAGKDSGDANWEGLAYQRLEAARAAIALATGAAACPMNSQR